MLPCGYQKDLGFPHRIRETAIHSLNRVRAVAESDKWNLELDWMCGELSTLPLVFFVLKKIISTKL